MQKVYLLLGGNTGDKLSNLHKALLLIEKQVGKIISKSPVYETAPWGFETRYSKSGNGNMFLNQAVCVETSKSPGEVLSQILKIEFTMGRNRAGDQRNVGAGGESRVFKERIIDVDILLYNDIVVENDNLIIPHPYLHLRRFVLVPLTEIAADVIHPKLHKTIKALREECEDELGVRSMMGDRR
ncbi:MAG: 2-amino-4-hydroxy-6-hydroxymethyldihydropteridine diphosphokinase [Bacteroidota bacterium]